ncbi:aminotransferase class I/II-fold pyridoxal phosphate-dependent enzyme [Nonomuraea sp. NPDC049655]|uniref:aminotransferase class I/II-fold pyridoxal phosphate-dependent enzyme n=1 Tax=Nonomuraea sp. NPDC049655 TaxID=3364355 RepID=UPI0037B24245
MDFSRRWSTAAPGVIPLTIADMDFAPDPAIVTALQERLRHPLVYPQPYSTSGVAQDIGDYYRRTHRVDVPVERIRIFASTAAAMYVIFDRVLEAGDEVLYFAPSYHHLPDSVTAAGGRAVPVELHPSEGFDPEKLRSRIGPRTKAVLICNPHNPTGHQFSREQLRDLVAVAAEHDLLIVANELHSRLSHDGAFVPLSSVEGVSHDRLITLSGATKSHNLSGLGGAFAFSLGESLIPRLWAELAGRLPSPSALAQTALSCAYREDSPWLRTTLDVLGGNRRMVSRQFRENLPAVRFLEPAATYFAWLDFSALRLEGDAAEVVQDACRVALLPGAEFGAPAAFARMTFASTPDTLQLALTRLIEGLSPWHS